MSPSDLKKIFKENRDIAAIIPVHLYGLACKTQEIEKAAAEASANQSRKIKVLYDAAHGFGASRGGRRVGSFGDAEVFSLSVTKALTTVEGGLISSRNPEFIEAVKVMRNYGMVPGSYNSTLLGLNGKMSEFHAIVGIANLKRLPKVLRDRKKLADYFSAQVVKKTPFAFMQVPKEVVHTYKDFTIIVPEKMKQSRDKIMAFLRENGVETRAYFFPPAHEQSLFKKFHNRPLPKTEDLSRRVITLPFFTTLSKTEIDYMVAQLVKAAKAFA